MNESHFWGSGWSFPPTFEAGNCRLNLTHEVDNINQSIDIILHTQQGERSVYFYFGSDLRSYIFRKKDVTLKGEIQRSVEGTLVDYEPRIDVDEVRVEFSDEEQGEVRVLITYTIKDTNTRHNYVFPFLINEGTNI